MNKMYKEMEARKVRIGGEIFSRFDSNNNKYEEVKIYYAGMPSKNIFSIVYQYTKFSRNTIEVIKNSSSSHRIPNIETNMQLFYPINQKKIHLNVKEESIDFKILKIDPKFLRLEDIE